MSDIIIVGSGYAGSVMAERFANDLNKKVIIIEKRDHIAGNMFDWIDENGVRVHKYGPHLNHTNSERVYEYLSDFTEWYPYEHKVLGLVQEQFVSIPFNLAGIEACFSEEKATHLKNILIQEYGMGTKVPILKLREHSDKDIQELAEFIYENVFLYYTMKQWGLKPDEIDPNVTNRVPVNVSYDDRYFNDTYQCMPKEGYTPLFEKMLSHPNIEVRLNTEANDVLKVSLEDNKIYFEGKEFEGQVIYTGAIDTLFEYQLGELEYRSLDFDLQSKEGTFQPVGTVNYPTPKEMHPYTRITEYKHMMEVQPKNTTIAVEYSLPYQRDAEKGNIPYYPVFTEEGQEKYNQYVALANQFKQLTLLGRLAEYRYYNMDAIVLRALEVYDQLKVNLK